MSKAKQRVWQHLMEDESLKIVREVLPAEWLIREYRPDYGIDLVLELFEFSDAARRDAVTLGETLFVQVKSTDVLRRRDLQVYARRNVAREPLREDRSETLKVEVAPLRIETSELLTVQAMGAAVPVLMLVVEVSTRSVYFVCLNDLIEKVIVPADPSYHEKKSKVINVPLRNRVSQNDEVSALPLKTYAKRAKLYAAFVQFGYQQHELEYAWEAWRDAPGESARNSATADYVALVRHFLALNLRFDFWTRVPEWAPLRWSFIELSALNRFLSSESLASVNAVRGYLVAAPVERMFEDILTRLDPDESREQLFLHINRIWFRLGNLSRIYEELGREWFLPTYLSASLVEI